MLSVLVLDGLNCRFLAKILVPEGSKDVPVGQPIAITVTCDIFLSMIAFSFHGKPSSVNFLLGNIFNLYNVLLIEKNISILWGHLLSF